MKKTVLFILSAVLMLGLIACSNEKVQSSNNDKTAVNSKEQSDKNPPKNDVRKIVWAQLTSEQKGWVNGTWKDGKISKITLNENMMSQIKDKSYKDKVVYLIEFPTKSKSIPNNMIVYADVNTFDYIGIGLVD